MSNTLTSILKHNHQFVAYEQYTDFLTTCRYPKYNLAILACMDSGLIELLPKALGIKNGDAALITSVGALIMHPWGSIMTSLLIAVYELKVSEIMVIAHHNCRAKGMNATRILDKVYQEGIKQETIDAIRNSGIDLDAWLEGFETVESGIIHTTDVIKKHPLMPARIKIHGLVIDPSTGQLTLIKEGK